MLWKGEAALEFVLKNMRHSLVGPCPETDSVTSGAMPRPPAPTSATHGVVDVCVHVRNGHAGQRGGSGYFARGLDEFTTVGRLG